MPSWGKQPKQQEWWPCNKCGSWAYTWRLRKQGWWCKCGEKVDAAATAHAHEGAWPKEAVEAKTELQELLDKLGSVLAKSADPGKVKTLLEMASTMGEPVKEEVQKSISEEQKELNKELAAATQQHTQTRGKADARVSR